MKNPRIRAAATTGLLEAVDEAGGQPLRVLAAADLVPAELIDPDRFIDMHRIAALFEAAAAETGNPLFGLRMSLTSTPEVVGTLSYLLLNAPTVETALRNLERYSSLHMPGVPVFMERSRSIVHLVLEMRDARLGPCRQLVEACVGFTLMLLRTLTRQELVPRQVLFAHARPAHPSEHVRLFGAPVRFGQPRNELLFDHEWLAYPIARSAVGLARRRSRAGSARRPRSPEERTPQTPVLPSLPPGREAVPSLTSTAQSIRAVCLMTLRYDVGRVGPEILH